jgi:hypothetical protein
LDVILEDQTRRSNVVGQVEDAFSLQAKTIRRQVSLQQASAERCDLNVQTFEAVFEPKKGIFQPRPVRRTEEAFKMRPQGRHWSQICGSVECFRKLVRHVLEKKMMIEILFKIEVMYVWRHHIILLSKKRANITLFSLMFM